MWLPPLLSAPSPEGVKRWDHTDMECVYAYIAPAHSTPRGKEATQCFTRTGFARRTPEPAPKGTKGCDHTDMRCVYACTARVCSRPHRYVSVPCWWHCNVSLLACLVPLRHHLKA